VAIICHAKDGYVLLFGRQLASGPLRCDTWKFAGGEWTQLTYSVSPTSRYDLMLVNDGSDTPVPNRSLT
jgi:hypothetical protein